MNTNKKKELEENPKYKAADIKAFDNRLLARTKATKWQSGEEVMDWWINGGNKYVDPNQISFMEEL